MHILFEIEQAVIVGGLNSVTPYAVRVFLWLSESLLLVVLTMNKISSVLSMTYGGPVSLALSVTLPQFLSVRM